MTQEEQKILKDWNDYWWGIRRRNIEKALLFGIETFKWEKPLTFDKWLEKYKLLK